MPSSCFFSLESSWAFFGSFQTAGSSREALTVLRRSDLASKSKIPPEGLRAGGEIGQLRADQVDAFCVHVVLIRKEPDFGTDGTAGQPNSRTQKARKNAKDAKNFLEVLLRPLCTLKFFAFGYLEV